MKSEHADQFGEVDHSVEQQARSKRRRWSAIPLLILLFAGLVWNRVRLNSQERRLLGSWQYQTLDTKETNTATFDSSRTCYVKAPDGLTYLYKWRVSGGRLILVQPTSNQTIGQTLRRNFDRMKNAVTGGSVVFDIPEVYHLKWSGDDSIELVDDTDVLPMNRLEERDQRDGP